MCASYFPYFSTKTYVVGAQKNFLNKTIKQPSQCDGSFEHPKQMLKLMDANIPILRSKHFAFQMDLLYARSTKERLTVTGHKEASAYQQSMYDLLEGFYSLVEKVCAWKLFNLGKKLDAFIPLPVTISCDNSNAKWYL